VKKKFYDIGSHHGQSLSMFYDQRSDASEFDIFAFEPLAESFEKLVSTCTKNNWSNVLCSMKLVGNTNIIRDVYVGKTNAGVGSTMLRGKITGNIDYQLAVRKECVRFVDFLRATSEKDDYIVVKINAEGAEYEILVDLYRSGAFKRINKLVVFFHSNKFSPADIRKQMMIIESESIKAFRRYGVDVRPQRHAFADNKKPRIVWMAGCKNWGIKFQFDEYNKLLTNFDNKMYIVGAKSPEIFKREIAEMNPDIVFCPFPHLCIHLNDWEIVTQRLGSIRMFGGGPTIGWMCDRPDWAFDILADEYSKTLVDFRHRKHYCAGRNCVDVRGNDLTIAMTPANFKMLDDLNNVIIRLDGFRSLTWKQSQPSCM